MHGARLPSSQYLVGGGGGVARGVVERGVEVAPEILQRAPRRARDLLAPGVRYLRG